MWKNESDTDNNWIKVKLEGTESNRQGIGSFIELSVNGEKQYNYTLCGEGYLGQNSSYEFFGIGEATQIDYLKVQWLSGIEDVIMNPEINTSHTVVEGEHILGLTSFDQETISLYPNPANSIVQVSGIDNYVQGTLQVIDISGRIVKTLIIDQDDMSIDVNQFSEGVYILTLQRENVCLLYTSPSPRDQRGSRMPSSA